MLMSERVRSKDRDVLAVMASVIESGQRIKEGRRINRRPSALP